MSVTAKPSCMCERVFAREIAERDMCYRLGGHNSCHNFSLCGLGRGVM